MRRALPPWAAFGSAVAGGLLLDAATPELAWWWAALPGAALVFAAVWRQHPLIAAIAGFGAGAAFWLPHISWLTLYLGPIPWLGLASVMVLWFVVFGVAAGAATRGLAAVPGLGDRALALAVAQALAVAGLWVIREQLQGAWPYGGFPWGRLAHTQADGPLLQAVSWTGFAGLSGVIAFACALPVAAIWTRRLRGVGVVSVIGGSLALLLGCAALPLAPQPSTGSLRVAAVQGNSKSAIFDDRESGDVIRDHVEETAALLDELERSGESVDVIVWPENSAEFDLPGDPRKQRAVQQLAERAGAPIVLGTIIANDDGSYTNSSVVWGAEGDTGARYDKNFPVPFAEYMPHRNFYRALVPELVDLVQLEYAPGTLPAAFDVETEAGLVRAGIAICFDIIFDRQAVEMVGAGAEVIFAQTNNADFGRTDESAQQLAIARLRAVEMGRSVVNISTVATSEMVAPDGKVLAAIEPHTAGAMVAEVPLASGTTPALRFGSVIASFWALLGIAGLAPSAAAVLVRLRRRWRRV
ncbi:MAG: apolipoprotein N-acyltransferase [Leucobacter sp.]